MRVLTVLAASIAVALVTVGSTWSAPAAGGKGARVVVLDSGFSQKGEFVDMGVVLRNTSAVDAVNVAWTYILKKASGDTITTYTTTIPVIPARTTYYKGTGCTSEDRVSRLASTIAVESSVTHRYRLPRVSQVRVQKRQTAIGPELTVSGVITNTLARTLSKSTHIEVVLYDRRDRIVGGTFTFPPKLVAPGKSVRWKLPISSVTSGTMSATHARATAENMVALTG